MKRIIVNETNLLFKDNHTLGCNLEGYADILRFRGFDKEAKDLDEIGARLK